MQKSVKTLSRRIPKGEAGFSLFELLIALAIIGILAAIAYPSYQHHLAKTRRKHAEIILTDTAAKLEHYKTEHNSYLGATLENIKAKKANGYTIKITQLEDDYFLLEAIPNKTMEHNTNCSIIKSDNLHHHTYC
ncbi:MAG: prepilin-type N-terminal cleavage/methylation domain-containing protein [Gammaproteobacteria bacterium]|nr:prepilin-type N-terminal cleavage/methylation domain-containing protein [Gammaproteobacteria bacterium]